jgi:Uma2 family endonuclease
MTALLREELCLPPEEYLTPEEYLALEEASPIKHEYANGYVYAMAGASRAHNLISTNLMVALGTQLEGKPCVPFGSDMRLRVRLPEETFYYYPDLTVDCSAQETVDTEDPTVIFEILSVTTHRNDRGEKLIHYLNLPSMRVYALVDQRRVHVTVHRRGEDGTWGREVLTDLDASVALPEIGCTLPLRTIYRRLPFADAP